MRTTIGDERGEEQVSDGDEGNGTNNRRHEGELQMAATECGSRSSDGVDGVERPSLRWHRRCGGGRATSRFSSRFSRNFVLATVVILVRLSRGFVPPTVAILATASLVISSRPQSEVKDVVGRLLEGVVGGEVVGGGCGGEVASQDLHFCNSTYLGIQTDPAIHGRGNHR